MGDEFQIEEERRLAYVGITRAERMLYITHAHSRMIFGSRRRQRRSRFLEDLPKDLIEQRGDMDQILMPHLPKLEEEAGIRLPGQRKIDIQALVNRAKEAGKLAAQSAEEDAAAAKPAPAPAPTSAKPTMTAARPDRGRKAAAAPAAAPAVECVYKAGSKIVHRKFGGGIVVSVKAGDDPELTIAFPKGGVKKILASFVDPA